MMSLPLMSCGFSPSTLNCTALCLSAGSCCQNILLWVQSVRLYLNIHFDWLQMPLPILVMLIVSYQMHGSS